MAKYTRFDPRNKKTNKNKYRKDNGPREYDTDKFDRKSKALDRHELHRKLQDYYEDEEDLS